MALPVAVALTNIGFLRELCGPNDTNLRAFEEVLGAPVRSRGNELLLDTDNADQRRRFAAMLDWLREQAGTGRTLDRFAIAAAHQAVTAPERTLRATGDDPVMIPGGLDRVYARSERQSRYLDALTRHELVVAIGPAGTGKTFLAVAAALRAVLSRDKRRLVVTRPVVEAGENLGFLPGDLAQKVDPYLRPLYDAMDALVSSDTLRRMEETRAIEVAPLAYMRGRTLADSYVILDEAQNTTREQMKMFLTRLGEGARAVITGDITQVDLPRPQDSGLIHIMSVLSQVQEVCFVHLGQRDVVRSALVRKIVRAYEAIEQPRSAGERSAAAPASDTMTRRRDGGPS
jgi:phosphate starvation-inducible PhoH-like protein